MVDFPIIMRRFLMMSLALALFFTASPALALRPVEDFDEAGGILSSAVIKSKGEAGLVINGRRCQLSPSVIMFDILGKKIPLCDLPVPCEAKVEYIWPMGDDPVCTRVEVIRLLEGDTESG